MQQASHPKNVLAGKYEMVWKSEDGGTGQAADFLSSRICVQRNMADG
jgi:hypothetical protein